jgi:hypothetical protein
MDRTTRLGGYAMRKPRPLLLLQSVALGAVLVLAACGGSSGNDIKGTVTKLDVNAKTFSVHATDGKDYNFQLTSSSKGEINEIKSTHLDKKEQVEVKYKGASTPYEVISAD